MEKVHPALRRTASLTAALLCALFCAFLLAVPAAAATATGESAAAPETAKTPATAETAARTIRVGYYQSGGFQEYDEASDTYSGYSYEFLMALAQYTDWNYEFVPCTFADSLDMLRRGELDLVNNVSRTAEREDVYAFTSLPSGENTAYLIAPQGGHTVAYEDFAGIAGLRIGLANTSIYNDRLLNLLAEQGVAPQITRYNTRAEVIDAVENGRVDAYIATSSNITDEHIILSFAPDSYYIAVNRERADLVGELDTAILALRTNDPAFEARIREKYYGKASENYITLTAEEQAYLDAAPEVRVSYQANWYPVSYRDGNGEFAGAVRGVYDLLSERTGLQFTYVPLEEEEDVIAVNDAHASQIIAELPSDFGYASRYGVKITRPFISPAVMQVSDRTLDPGETIALVEGDYLSKLAKKLYGTAYNYLPCTTVDECMRAIKDGKAAATILIFYESEYYRQQPSYAGLNYRIVEEGSYGLSIAVANAADPRLYQIVQKGLNAISDGEIAEVFNNTLLEVRRDDLSAFFYRHPYGTALVACVVLTLALGVFYGIWFNSSLKRKNRVIAAQNEDLQRAERANAEFFASMSHDMRTPLNGILGSTALALEEPHTEQMGEYLGDIRYSGRFLLNLINDILDLSKMNNDAMELFPESYSYRQFIRDIERMIEPLCREKNITLDLHPLDIDSAIWVDKLRFQQIFFNIFSNAVKYTPAGGRIDHYTEITPLDEKHIECNCRIVDTGIGMSEEFCKKLFEPYTRAGGNDQVQGTGLGLTIANKLAHLMGGEITVKSELGKGTAVTVHTVMKLADPPAAQGEEHEHTAAAAAVDLSGRHFLLCEDHPLNTKIAVKLLEKRGATVDTAANGEVGVKLFADSANGAYDLILMDIRMPVLDGLEAARRIRALPRPDAKTVPILAMTANAYESDVQSALKAGMNAHLAKPIEPAVLYAALADYLPPKRNDTHGDT